MSFNLRNRSLLTAQDYTQQEFKFLLDADNYIDTTISSATTQGATTFSANSTATLATSDTIYVEDANDPTKFEWRSVTSFTVSTVTITPALSRSFSSGSVVRHAEYHPAWVVTSRKPPFVERRAGQGARLWDLKFTFQTVR